MGKPDVVKLQKKLREAMGKLDESRKNGDDAGIAAWAKIVEDLAAEVSEATDAAEAEGEENNPYVKDAENFWAEHKAELADAYESEEEFVEMHLAAEEIRVESDEAQGARAAKTFGVVLPADAAAEDVAAMKKAGWKLAASEQRNWLNPEAPEPGPLSFSQVAPRAEAVALAKAVPNSTVLEPETLIE